MTTGDVLSLAGCVPLVAAGFLTSIAAGLAVVGAECVARAYLLERRANERPTEGAS